MRNPSPLPHPLPVGPFRYAEAKAAGVARSRLRAADLVHAHHGLYAPGTGETGITAACERLVPLLGEHQWFSHLTAARLWGMPLPFFWRVTEPLHVLAMSGSAPIRRAGVVGWETEDSDLPRSVVGGLPVVSPADVWCQLAVRGATGIDERTGFKRNLTPEWLVAVGDYLLTGPRIEGERRPLCTLAELEHARRRRWGKRGAKDLEWAIERVRTPVHSPQETKLRLGLVAHGLPEPELQVPVLTADGWRHADLGYPAARLLLEFQGDHHRTDRRQWLSDLTRIQQFEDAGYRTMLVGADDVEPTCAPLAFRVRRALAQRSPRP